MTTTPVLGATDLVAAQALPETTVNETVRRIEQGAAWFQFKDRDLATPPGSPADGDCYLIAGSPTGAWAGHAGEVTYYQTGSGWKFITPREGMGGGVQDENVAVAFLGGSWVTLATAGSTPFEMEVACSDETTALTTGTAKVTFRMPRAVTLTAVRANLVTPQTSGSIFTVDINEGGVSILSTKLTIDNGEKTSTTAATPPVISDTSLADDAEMTVDIDGLGDGTAKGLKIVLIGTRT